MKNILAVDIGGTQMRAACFSTGCETPSQVNRIKPQHDRHSRISELYQLIESVWPEDGSVDWISVAAPGPLDSVRGILIAPPNIPEWHDFPLRELLHKHFNTPTIIGNDANLAALGEWKFGAGRGHHHLIYLTVSTGIGSGIIIDDRLLTGSRGLAPELGHVTILPDGPICPCGQPGHLEGLAAGRAIEAWIGQQLLSGVETSLIGIHQPTAEQVAAAASEGDPLALSAFQRAGEYIGLALASYLHIFNPTIIIIGGGVARSGSILLSPIKAALNKYVMISQYLEGLEITLAHLGDNAGLMGAFAQACIIEDAS
jgi:glucokinase